MTTRAKELPRVLDLPGQDPNCLTCHPVKPGKVTMAALWAWSLEHPGQPPLRSATVNPRRPSPQGDPE